MVTKLKARSAKLKTGDTVRVILGKDRGKRGKIVASLPREGRVIVEGLGLVKKHVKARRAGEKGQRVTSPAAIDLSNVQLVCPHCNKGTRVGIRRQGKERVRVCRQCSAIVDRAK